MKLHITSRSLLTIVCVMVAVAPAMADTLYSNGAPNGNVDAFTINFGFAVSDSFTCGGSNGCSVEGFNFVTWSLPGDSLTSVEMQLGTSSFGSSYSDQVLSPSSSTLLFTNPFGFQITEYGFSFSNVGLPEGTSWITLSNAVVNTGGPIYWDQNSGPSTAFDSGVGSIPSESFTITGTTNGGETIPEPTSILLFGSGIFGLVGVLRRKLL